jgi:hypothetical protein
VLVCTFHKHQPGLLAKRPSLKKHPILGKWLYLPETSETFERDAGRPSNSPAPPTATGRGAVAAEEEKEAGKY